MGHNLPLETLCSSPELVYIGLVQKHVKPAFKAHVTVLLPKLLEQMKVEEAA